VAKTYLALLAGVAQARGLLDVAERVGTRVPGIGFDGEHNGAITWTHLLEQTSEWGGTCLGMPDQVEHNRRVGTTPSRRRAQGRGARAAGAGHATGNTTTCASTSCRWRCCTCSAGRCRRCSSRPCCARWAAAGLPWVGYDDAWVTIDGQRLPSVPGGSHWGGGVSIGARDQARIGQLLLDGGGTKARQLLPAEWVRACSSPAPSRRSTAG
jgi:CubicO group peptidase (beta-lactamase class C family)